MAFPTHIAAALTGASPSQLAYWRRGPRPLLAPAERSSRGCLYSYEDVVALRTFVFLRGELPLQRIRTAMETLRGLGAEAHPARYRLVRTGQSIAWVDGSDAIDLVDQPRQAVLASLDDVLAEFTNVQGDAVVPLASPRPRLQVSPEVVAGYPVVLDTRVPFDVIGALMADGVPADEVAAFYPTVDSRGAEDAFSFYEYTERFRGSRLVVAG